MDRREFLKRTVSTALAIGVVVLLPAGQTEANPEDGQGSITSIELWLLETGRDSLGDALTNEVLRVMS